jgi:hypothetical protein
LAVAFTASAGVLAGFGVFVRAQCEWLPWQEDLAVPPNPEVTRTPSLWLSAEVGVSFER